MQNQNKPMTEAFGKLIKKSSLNSDLKLKIKEFLDKLNETSTREKAFRDLKEAIMKYTAIEQVKVIFPIIISYSSRVSTEIGREFQIILIGYALHIGYIKSSDRQILSKLIEAIASYLTENHFNIHKACSVVIMELYDLICIYEDSRNSLEFIINYFINLIDKNYYVVSNVKDNGIVNGSFLIINDLISYVTFNKDYSKLETEMNTLTKLTLFYIKVVRVHKFNNPNLLETLGHLISIVSFNEYKLYFKDIIYILLNILYSNDSSIYLSKIECCCLFSHYAEVLKKYVMKDFLETSVINDVYKALEYATKDKVLKVQVSATETLIKWKNSMDDKSDNCNNNINLPNIDNNTQNKEENKEEINNNNIINEGISDNKKEIPRMSKLNLLRNLSKIHKEKVVMTSKDVRKEIYEVGIGKFLRTNNFISNRDEENLQKIKEHLSKSKPKEKRKSLNAFRENIKYIKRNNKNKDVNKFSNCANIDYSAPLNDNINNNEISKNDSDNNLTNSDRKKKFLSKKSSIGSKEENNSNNTSDNNNIKLIKTNSKQNDKSDRKLNDNNDNNNNNSNDQSIENDKNNNSKEYEKNDQAIENDKNNNSKEGNKSRNDSKSLSKHSSKHSSSNNLKKSKSIISKVTHSKNASIQNKTEIINNEKEFNKQNTENNKIPFIEEKPNEGTELLNNNNLINNNINNQLTFNEEQQNEGNEQINNELNYHINNKKSKVKRKKKKGRNNSDDYTSDEINEKSNESEEYDESNSSSYNNSSDSKNKHSKRKKKKNKKNKKEEYENNLKIIFNNIKDDLKNSANLIESNINNFEINVNKQIEEMSSKIDIIYSKINKNSTKVNQSINTFSNYNIKKANNNATSIDNTFIEEEQCCSVYENDNSDYESKNNNIWNEINKEISYNNYEEAFNIVLKSNDDLDFLKLVLITKEKCLKYIPCQLCKEIIIKLNAIFRCFMVQNIILDYITEFYNLNMFSYLSEEEKNDLMQTVYEIGKIDNIVGNKANYIYHEIIHKNNNDNVNNK